MNTHDLAIFADDGKFRFAELPVIRRSSADEVLVRIERIALNRGEAAFSWQPGIPAGWDGYGTVVEGSDSGDGPKPGTRVVTWGFSGAWATHRAVSVHNVAEVPAEVPDTVAAGLPVAGLTALRAIRQINLRPGQSVAVTGASGGVGHLAIQLGRNCGLVVTAIVRSEESGAWLGGLEAARGIEILTVDEVPESASFDAVIDNVGGQVLTRLMPRVTPGGTVLLVGGAAGEPAELDTAAIVGRGLDLMSFNNHATASTDLAILLRLLAEGAFRIEAADEGDWSLLTEKPVLNLINRGKSTFAVGGEPR
jgi:NADPH:quinone reductase-like Zn-dependent oxidoreductase